MNIEKSLDELGIKYGTDKSSKGHNYLKSYEHYLREYRDMSFSLIEIGGLNGASLEMWAEYFTKADIICLDINPDVKRFEAGRIRVEIGDAGNPDFLRDVASRYENIAVVVDDGSHRWDHARIAFTTLFPAVSPGGSYIVEDLHTSFEARYAGSDELPFSETLLAMSRVLLARGEIRRTMSSALSPRMVETLSSTESVAFLNRSCIVRKKQRHLA